MVFYVVGIVSVFFALDLWTLSLLKDTIIWFVFVAAPLAFSLFASRSNENVVSVILAESLRLTVLVEFLVNEYTFSLPVELVFVPFLTFVMLLHGFASADEEYSVVAKLFDGLRVLIGLGLLVFVVSRSIADCGNLFSIPSARELFLVPALSLVFIPFLYFMLILISYESLFNVLKAGSDKDDWLKGYARRRLISHLKLDLKRIRRFHRAHGFDLARVQSKGDVDSLLDPPRD